MFKKVVGATKAYLNKAKGYSPLRFVFEMTVIAFLIKILFSVLADIILSLIGIHLVSDLSFEKQQVTQGLIIIGLTVPLFAAIETVIGQMLILWISSRFTKKAWIRILTSAVIFTALHLDPAQMIAVFPVGLILAWSFLTKREKSLWSAFWMTTAIHSLHNYLALLLVWLSYH